jgi:hypothetical protein
LQSLLRHNGTAPSRVNFEVALALETRASID